METLKTLVSVREFSELLRRSERSIYEDIAAGRIKGVYRIRHTIRVDPHEALEALRRSTTPQDDAEREGTFTPA